MAYDVTITGFNKNEEVIFSIDANWIDGFYLVSDKRFKEFEVNPGYLDMSASLSIDEMKEFHKENDSKYGRSTYKEEMKFIDDALNVYGDKVYSRFVVDISEW
jgi:hypothetical protein